MELQTFIRQDVEGLVGFTLNVKLSAVCTNEVWVTPESSRLIGGDFLIHRTIGRDSRHLDGQVVEGIVGPVF